MAVNILWRIKAAVIGISIWDVSINKPSGMLTRLTLNTRWLGGRVRKLRQSRSEALPQGGTLSDSEQLRGEDAVIDMTFT